MVEVAVRGATKVYGGPHGVKALSDVSITAADGEFLVLLGPSGSGKTTLLRAIAGLETLDAGDIFIGDRCVTHVDPGARNIGMVFQDYALYPHMTVRGNIEYNMKLRGLPKAEVQQRANEVAAMLRLESLLDRRPGQLSGGQRQRVALGRAITRDSSVLLMDEPLSNLDAQIREHVRVELRELQRRIGVTTIYVTHDQVEAMVVADRIAVMSNARIEQIGPPETIYDLPDTLFCARFVGSPKANEVRGALRWTGRNTLDFIVAAKDGGPGVRLFIDADEIGLPDKAEKDSIAVFRPEDVQQCSDGVGFPFSLLFVENRGAEKFAVVELPPPLRHAQSSADLRLKVDRSVAVLPNAFVPRRMHLFDEATGLRIATGKGRPATDNGVTASGRIAAPFSGGL
jgi:sn-glycerol 3-phosphate transport system ATP-binding protein